MNGNKNDDQIEHKRNESIVIVRWGVTMARDNIVEF